MSGGAVVFRGLTDDHGRFETTPLAPGVYTFQLRIPKTMITPARYSLALSGARPMGDALVGPGVAVAMQAEVRRNTSVKGQASGRRVILVPAANAPAVTANAPAPGAVVRSSNGTMMRVPVQSSPNTVARPNTPTAAGSTATTAVSTATRPSSASMTANRAVTPPLASTPPRVNPSPATVVPNKPPTAVATARVSTATGPKIAANSTVSRPAAAILVAQSPGGASAAPRTAVTAPVTQPGGATVATTNATAPRYAPRVVNGRRYIWVPSAPGSSIGRWVPDPTPPTATAARAQATASTPPRR